MGGSCCTGRNNSQDNYQEVQEEPVVKNPFAALFGEEHQPHTQLLAKLDPRGFRIGYEAFLGIRKNDIHKCYQLGKALPHSTTQSTYQGKSFQTGVERIVKVETKTAYISKNRDLVHKIEIARQIDHPHVIRVLEVYETDKLVFYVTEHHPGGDLLEKMINEPKMPEKKIAGYIKQILQGLAYLHSKNIAHRDIRPQKILFSNITNEATVILAGFEHMKQFGHNDILTDNVGQLDYKAPEVIERKYNEKCDMWSVGIILFRLLCNRPPFLASTDDKMLAVIHNKPIDFEALEVSNEARGLLQLLLQVDPAQRISAASALNHPWFNIVSKLDRKEFVGPLQTYKNFHAKSDLQHMFLVFMFNQFLKSHERERFNVMFNEIDTDHDGSITSDEISACLDTQKEGRLSQSPSRRSHAAGVSYTDFVVAILSSEERIVKEKAELAFRNLDTDEDGLLKKGDLENVLGGLKLTPSDIAKIFAEAGTTEAQGISRQQFLKLVL